MAKKKLILSQEQIERICEGEDFVYLSDLASKPDLGNIYATEVTTDGSVEDAYADPTTTDDFASTTTNNWRGNAKLAGMGPIVVHEMSKKDWEKTRLVSENIEHGNARLIGRKFGGKNGVEGKSYGATKMAISRKNAAEKKLNSNNPSLRASGAKTLRKMHQNWDGLDVADAQYTAAKASDKITQQNKPDGAKIKSAPKESGNGKAHSPKNGVFLN